MIDKAFHQCFALTKKTGSVLIYCMIIMLSVLSVVAPGSVSGAESRIQPALAIGEEYNDNIFLTSENRSSDFISRVVPAINFMYKAPLWDWDLNGYYEYRYYARFHDYVTQNTIPNLNLANHTRIKDEYIFLDVNDNYSKTSLDPVRNFTQESAFINQTDKNVLTIVPYFIIRPTLQMTVTTGYTYSNIWYKDPAAIDQVYNIVYTGFQQDISKRFNMIGGIKHTQNNNSGLAVSSFTNMNTAATSTVQSYTQDDVYLGQRYEYVENSVLSVTVGNTWFRIPETQTDAVKRVSQVTWDAYLTQIYSTMTVTYETGLRFIPDPEKISRREDRYLVTIRRDSGRTSIIAAGGLLEYRNIVSKHLENSTYLISGTIDHSLSSKSKIILNLEADWYKDYVGSTKTQRYLSGARFERLLAEKLTLALFYNYSHVYSPDVSSSNYFNNRYSVELRMVF